MGFLRAPSLLSSHLTTSHLIEHGWPRLTLLVIQFLPNWKDYTFSKVRPNARARLRRAFNMTKRSRDNSQGQPESQAKKQATGSKGQCLVHYLMLSFFFVSVVPLCLSPEHTSFHIFGASDLDRRLHDARAEVENSSLLASRLQQDIRQTVPPCRSRKVPYRRAALRMLL